jgi:hypothetical protein
LTSITIFSTFDIINNSRNIIQKKYITQYLFSMNIRELKKLKKRMPRGWQKKLYERFGGKHSKPAIEAVMNGRYNNDEIIDGAIELAEKHQASLKAKIERIKSL